MTPILPAAVTRAVSPQLSFAAVASVALGAFLAALAYHGILSALNELCGDQGARPVIPNVPDHGIPSKLYDVMKHGYYDSKRNGQRDDTMLVFMGGSLAWIGVTMVLKGLKSMQKEGSGGRYR